MSVSNRCVFSRTLSNLIHIFQVTNRKIYHGSESLPPGIVAPTTDLFLRRLWGNPNEVKTWNWPVGLLWFEISSHFFLAISFTYPTLPTFLGTVLPKAHNSISIRTENSRRNIATIDIVKMSKCSLILELSDLAPRDHELHFVHHSL